MPDRKQDFFCRLGLWEMAWDAAINAREIVGFADAMGWRWALRVVSVI
jgi:hypothetical protein